jgi:hypothetical protein
MNESEHYCGVSTERWLTILSHDQVSHCPSAHTHTQSNKYRFAPGVLSPNSYGWRWHWHQAILQEICSVFFSPFPFRYALPQTKETCGEERRPDFRHTWGRTNPAHARDGRRGQGAIPALHARCNQWVARTTDKTPAHLNKGDIWPCMPARARL